MDEKTPLTSTLVIKDLQNTTIKDGLYTEDHNKNSPQGDVTEIPMQSGEDKKKEKKEKFKFSNLPKRGLLTLASCALGGFCSGCVFSVLAPFYPGEATQKGLSSTMTGLIFSIFQLVFLFSSPVFGNYINLFGAKFLYISGLFLSGGSTLLFGFLDKSPPGTPFMLLSLLCRCVQALGMSAILTSGFAIISCEFPKHVATVFGIVKTIQATGLMIGPGLGGALFEIGGFGLPFFVLGGVILLNGVLISRHLPQSQETPTQSKKSIFVLLKSPLIIVAFLCLIVVANGITFLDPTLANHLKKFKLTPFSIGLVMAIAPTMDGITAPLWGYLCDTKNLQYYLIVIGNLVCCIGMLCTGPSPWLPFLPFDLWMVILGLFMYGFCVGSILIPVMKSFVNGTKELGLDDSLGTYGMVAGLYNVGFCVGAFAGPMLGGAFEEEIGFRTGSSVIGFIHFFAMLLALSFFAYRRFLRKRHYKFVQMPNTISSETKETSLTIPRSNSHLPNGQLSNGIHLEE